MNRPVPVLLYHRIDHSGLSTATTPTAFREHLQYLADRGWRSMALAEFESYAQAGKDFPKKRFLLSFDDGYESIASSALPIMKEFECKGVTFVFTKSIRFGEDTSSSANNNGRYKAFLTWDQIRTLQSSGMMEFQSHTHTHRNFTKYSLSDISEDLATSVSLLSRELRLPRRHFKHLAWPWGISFKSWRNIASDLGFKYQYTVAKTSFKKNASLVQIPRTCFDAKSVGDFQQQFRLQTGLLSVPWHLMYGAVRCARQIYGSLQLRHSTGQVDRFPGPANSDV